MKKRYKFGLIPLGVLIVLAVVGVLFADWHGQRVLEREIDAVVTQGGHRDFSSFAVPSLPDDENAATQWIESAVLGWGESTVESRAFGPDDTDEEVVALYDPAAADMAVLRRAIESRQPAIDAAWSAAERSGVRWPIDFADPLSWTDEDYLGQARQVGRLLAADAWLAIVDKDFARAEKSLIAILAVSDDVAVPPIIIGALVSFSLDALAIGVVEETGVNLGERMPRLAEAFADRDYLQRMAAGTLGEIPFGLAYLRSDDSDLAHLGRWPTRIWVRYDIAHYVRVMNHTGHFVGEPYHQIQAQLEALDQPTGFPYLLSGIFLPAMGAATKTANIIQTKRDLMLKADSIAAVDPVLRNEEWAKGLALPVDPLTGQLIKLWLSPEDDGFVLWSSAAEDRDMWMSHREVVWQSGTQSWPPELESIADYWADE